MRTVTALFSFLAAIVLAVVPANAAVIIYSGSNGASATADFQFIDSTTISVWLINTSTSPFNGGGAAAVLSSLNFDLPAGVNIIGGNVVLGTGSSIVTRSGSAWVAVTPAGLNLNNEYAYSNTGIGNTGSGTIPGATTAITSHSNGGSGAGLVRFTGTAGPGVTNGLEPGILATGTPVFGNSASWVMNSLLFTLNLSGNVTSTLDFLASGSFVEFGSDAQFVGGNCTSGCVPLPCRTDCDPGDNVPEPASMVLLGMGLIGAGLFGRRRK